MIPGNPYPKKLFTMTADQFCEAVPDETLRTSISGHLGRHFWAICSLFWADLFIEWISGLLQDYELDEELVENLKYMNERLNIAIQSIQNDVEY